MSTNYFRDMLNKLTLLEDRIKDHPFITYTDVSKGKTEKVIADLRSHKSAVYTKLAANLEAIEKKKEEIKALSEEVKQHAREDVADLFDAEDAVKTRVVDTVSFIFELSKDPKPTVSYKYAEIFAELAQHLTPELNLLLADIKKKYETITPKAPSLSLISKKKPDLSESIGGKMKQYFAKFKNFVMNWADGYDEKLNNLKKQANIS
jgi:hypothetical protein